MIVVAEILSNLRTDKILTTAVQEGIFVASINVGIVLMLPLGAYLADKYGRLRTVIVGEIIVVVASLLQMFCFSALSLTLSRTCVGFGMALCVLLKPLYIAELANPNHRGKMITLFSVAFMSGVLVVALLATTMQSNQGNWRLLLGIGAVPSLLLILAAQFYLVESPVWLRMVEQRSNASASTGGDDGDGDDDDEARSLTTGALVANNDRHTPAKCSQVFCELFSTGATRNGVGGTTWIAFLSAMLYESDGMWMLVQYRNDVFKETVGQANVHLFAMLLCTVGLVANIVPILLVDRIGRRVLIMVGVTGSVLFKLIFAVVVGKKFTLKPTAVLVHYTLYIIHYTLPVYIIHCTDTPLPSPLFSVFERCQGRGLAGRVVVVVVGRVCSNGHHDRVQHCDLGTLWAQAPLGRDVFYLLVHVDGWCVAELCVSSGCFDHWAPRLGVLFCGVFSGDECAIADESAGNDADQDH
jgi:major inositol transporter-like SP family MFS transporter